MSATVLVTGALGLVGSETVKRLVADGRHVVASDLDTPANRKKSRKLPAGADIRWADLTYSGRRCREPDRRCGSRGDHPPRGCDSAGDLS